jgi:hypothetical protein
MSPTRNSAVPLEFARLVSDKRLIEAIKWLRARDGLDLQAAKARLDNYLATGKLELNERLDSGATQATGRTGVSTTARDHADPFVLGQLAGERRARTRRIITWVIVSDVFVLGAVAYYFWQKG